MKVLNKKELLLKYAQLNSEHIERDKRNETLESLSSDVKEYIKDLNKWIRLDARGNKENINSYFSLDEEHLAYKIRSELGEIDYHDNHADLDERLVNILMQSESIQEITTDFEF